MTTQYLCECANCQASKYVSYSTTRMHLSVYGSMEESIQEISGQFLIHNYHSIMLAEKNKHNHHAESTYL